MRPGRLVYWWCTANYLIAFIFGGVWYITSNDPEEIGGKCATKNSIEGSVTVIDCTPFYLVVNAPELYSSEHSYYNSYLVVVFCC